LSAATVCGRDGVPTVRRRHCRVRVVPGGLCVALGGALPGRWLVARCG
jgi:hypothetical protein